MNTESAPRSFPPELLHVLGWERLEPIEQRVFLKCTQVRPFYFDLLAAGALEELASRRSEWLDFYNTYKEDPRLTFSRHKLAWIGCFDEIALTYSRDNPLKAQQLANGVFALLGACLLLIQIDVRLENEGVRTVWVGPADLI